MIDGERFNQFAAKDIHDSWFVPRIFRLIAHQKIENFFSNGQRLTVTPRRSKSKFAFGCRGQTDRNPSDINTSSLKQDLPNQKDVSFLRIVGVGHPDKICFECV